VGVERLLMKSRLRRRFLLFEEEMEEMFCLTGGGGELVSWVDGIEKKCWCMKCMLSGVYSNLILAFFNTYHRHRISH
jgi:hypothetical protein